GCYIAWYDGNKFGITRWTQAGEKFDTLKECPAPQVYPDFFQLSLAAVGDTLTLQVNGKPLLQARDANFAAGDIGIGAWNSCRASFKDLEVFKMKGCRGPRPDAFGGPVAVPGSARRPGKARRGAGFCLIAAPAWCTLVTVRSRGLFP